MAGGFTAPAAAEAISRDEEERMNRAVKAAAAIITNVRKLVGGMVEIVIPRK